jgi:hypothetical protein
MPFPKSIAVLAPAVTDNITMFYTNTAITFARVVSVVQGTATPNCVFNLTYANTRATGTVGTDITGNITCTNTTNGLFTTTFTNATVPANNYVVLTFSTVSGTVVEFDVTMEISTAQVPGFFDQYARDKANLATTIAQYAANTGNNEISFIYSDRVANGLYQSWSSLYAAYQSANSPVCTIGFWAADTAPGVFLTDIPSGTYTFTIGTKFKGLVDSLLNPTPVQFADGARIIGVDEYENLQLQSNSSNAIQYLDGSAGPGGSNLVRYPVLRGSSTTGLRTQFFYCNSASMGIRLDTSSTLGANSANVNKQTDFQVYIIGEQTRINSNAFASNVATGRVDINRYADTPIIDLPQQGAGALFQGGVHYFDTGTRIGPTAARPQPSENGSFFYDTTLKSQIYAKDNVWTIVTHSGQAEVDFGITPVSETSFTVTDANVTTASIISGVVAYVAPTSKELDELEFDKFDLKFAPGSGQYTLYMASQDNSLVTGKFKINYTVG